MAEWMARWRLVSRLSMLAAVAVTACGGGGDEVDASRPAGAAVDSPAPGPATDVSGDASREAAQATTSTVTLMLRGKLMQGVGPILQLRVNGATVASQEIRATAFQSYSFTVPAIAGGAKVDVVFTNDQSSSTEDRDLEVQYLMVDGKSYFPSDSGVTYDRGYGAAAFDGQSVIAGQQVMRWSGALRFTMAAAAPAPSPSPSPAPAPTPAPAPAGAPVIITGPSSSKPGDIVGLTGEAFASNATVWLDASGASAAQQLPVINRVGSTWLAVQIPSNAASALSLRVVNGSTSSAAYKLNVARPHHLDALQLVPGTTFRVFGRSLMVTGGTPRVTVDGLAATVNTGASNEQMLVVTAPASLKATTAATISVDNGNGTGAAVLDRRVDVVFSGSGDPFGLGIGWTAGYAGMAGRVVQAASDSRLATKVSCNGSTNDAPALQAAVNLAAANGGGVVQLPAGTCRLAGGFGLKSNVVVQGAGKTSTVLRYEQDYPFWGSKLDLTGVRNLTLRNAGSARNGPSLVQSSRVVVQNVRFEMGTSYQLFFTENRNAVFAGNDFVQGGSLNEQGPFVMNEASGVAFLNNSVTYQKGSASFQAAHDVWIQGNRFTRDASAQWSAGVVHTLVLDFAHRVAVVGNTFDVINGPITNKNRNDGETILTEGGGAARTENLGTVASATATTLRDPATVIKVDPWGQGAIPENFGVAIVGGKGTGQTRRVTAYANSTLTVDRAWDVVPDTTSRYATFVWGLEKSLISGNTLRQNPRGIWLYQTAIRDVDIVGNTMSEGGGIYLRSYQSVGSRMFTPIYNVRIQDNQVSNTTHNWLSHINAMFVNTDARAFGTGLLGIEVRGNRVTANTPNLATPTEEYAGTEGYTNMMRVENYSTWESMAQPRVLGTIYQRNACTNCDVAVRIGTGVGGTVISNTTLSNSRALTSNSAVTSLTKEVAVNTLVQ